MRTIQVPRRFVRQAWGGTETVILETSRRLPELGHETEILCPRALADGDEETIDGVKVRRTGYFYPYLGLSAEAKGQLDRKAGNLVSFPLLRELLTRPDLDLVHLHTGKRLGGMVRTAARVRGIPYVVSLHGGVHDVPEEEARTWTEPTAGTWEWGKALGWCFGSRRVLDDAFPIGGEHPGRGVGVARLARVANPDAPDLELHRAAGALGDELRVSLQDVPDAGADRSEAHNADTNGVTGHGEMLAIGSQKAKRNCGVIAALRPPGGSAPQRPSR